MKKTILTLLIGAAFSINTYSQIGIMTENPATGTVLHIDAKSNNGTGGADVNSDDVVIMQNGNVGLGTITPQSKLHIVTGGTSATPKPDVKIEDGNQALNKVFMSDNAGAGQWSNYIPGYQQGTVGAGINYATTSATKSKTNMQITVDPGQWLIFYTISMTANSVTGQAANYRFLIRTAIGDNTIAPTTDAISKDRFSANGFMDKRTIINGWVAVDNNTLTSKTYSVYLEQVVNGLPGLNLMNIGDSADGYSNIYAFRIHMK